MEEDNKINFNLDGKEFNTINFTQSIYFNKIKINEDMVNILRNIKLDKKDNNLTSFYNENDTALSMQIFTYLAEEFSKLNKIIKSDTFRISKWWVQKYNKGDWHILHTHGTIKNSLSFVLYLDCTENSSEIWFFGPGHPTIEYDPIKFKPEKGLLIVFPSYLPHTVLPNEDYKRFILSGNITHG